MPNNERVHTDNETISLWEDEAERAKEMEEYKNLIQCLGYAQFND